MLLDRELVVRIERATAEDAAAVVAPLIEVDRSFGSTAAPAAGGQVVVLGPGMYVNRGMGMGLEGEATDVDLRLLEGACAAAGVAPEIEVSPWAHPSLLSLVAARAYRPVWFRTVLVRPLTDVDHTPASGVDIGRVDDAEALAVWQATAAGGFGYTTDGQRRVSDCFTAAIHRLDAVDLYVAHLDGEAVGVASLAVRDGVAILGGMTTLPEARGQGVQRALIRFRLAAALAAGCDLATTTAAPGSTSERNLLRGGFAIAYTHLGLRRA